MKKSKKNQVFDNNFENKADVTDYSVSDSAAADAVLSEEAPVGEAPSEEKKKGKVKKSTALKALSITLFALSFVIIFAVSLVLAVKSLDLVPYYSFWPFLGAIVIAVFGVIFMIVTLCVNRKKSKKSFRNQTICVLVTFFCLTTVFGILLNRVLPDLISKATQGTLYTDDLYTNGENQIEVNAALDRQFIRYNILNGNYDPQYSYYDLSKPIKTEDDLMITAYENQDVDAAYNEYYSQPSYQIASTIQGLSERQQELYDFIYDCYVLMDYDYAFSATDASVIKRQCFALALFDQIYPIYDKLCKEGFKNERLKYLRDNNFKSMDQDGYKTFDDPLLLFAQMEGRMTIPTVIRLILDDRFTYTTPTFDDNGNITGYDGYLYEGYAPQIRDEYEAKGGTYENGIGVDPDTGYIIHENGMVQRPMKWCVLDMDGNVMSVATFDLASAKIAGMDIGGLLMSVLFSNSQIVAGLGELLDRDLTNVIMTAANGAKLELHLYFNDAGMLDISIVPSNVETGMLGYMQMSWMNSNNLLFGVINLIGARNTLFIYGAMGLVLVFGACVCREYSWKCKKEEQEAAADKKEE